jgi:hypothetical protein
MSDPLQALIAAGVARTSPFSRSSRYFDIEIARYQFADGRSVSYVRRRIIPQPERFSTLVEHTVIDGDRLDNLAFQHFGDAELFWRLCDANRALEPDALTDVPGTRLRVTLPEGMAGGDDA